MSRYRITMTFELEITDDEQARALAADTMHQIVAQQDGQFVSPRGESPEVAIHGLSQVDAPVAAAVAVRLLAQGVAAVPWARFENYRVQPPERLDA